MMTEKGAEQGDQRCSCRNSESEMVVGSPGEDGGDSGRCKARLRRKCSSSLVIGTMGDYLEREHGGRPRRAVEKTLKDIHRQEGRRDEEPPVGMKKECSAGDSE